MNPRSPLCESGASRIPAPPSCCYTSPNPDRARSKIPLQLDDAHAIIDRCNRPSPDLLLRPAPDSGNKAASSSSIIAFTRTDITSPAASLSAFKRQAGSAARRVPVPVSSLASNAPSREGSCHAGRRSMSAASPADANAAGSSIFMANGGFASPAPSLCRHLASAATPQPAKGTLDASQRRPASAAKATPTHVGAAARPSTSCSTNHSSSSSSSSSSSKEALNTHSPLHAAWTASATAKDSSMYTVTETRASMLRRSASVDKLKGSLAPSHTMPAARQLPMHTSAEKFAFPSPARVPRSPAATSKQGGGEGKGTLGGCSRAASASAAASSLTVIQERPHTATRAALVTPPSSFQSSSREANCPSLLTDKKACVLLTPELNHERHCTLQQKRSLSLVPKLNLVPSKAASTPPSAPKQLSRSTQPTAAQTAVPPTSGQPAAVQLAVSNPSLASQHAAAPSQHQQQNLRKSSSCATTAPTHLPAVRQGAAAATQQLLFNGSTYATAPAQKLDTRNGAAATAVAACAAIQQQLQHRQHLPSSCPSTAAAASAATQQQQQQHRQQPSSGYPAEAVAASAPTVPQLNLKQASVVPKVSVVPNLNLNPQQVVPQLSLLSQQPAAVVPKLSHTPQQPAAVVPKLNLTPQQPTAVVPKLSLIPQQPTAVVPNLNLTPQQPTVVVPKLNLTPQQPTAVVPKLSLKPHHHTAVVPKLSLTPQQPTAVVPKLNLTLQQPTAVVPKLSLTPQQPTAVLPAFQQQPAEGHRPFEAPQPGPGSTQPPKLNLSALKQPQPLHQQLHPTSPRQPGSGSTPVPKLNFSALKQPQHMPQQLPPSSPCPSSSSCADSDLEGSECGGLETQTHVGHQDTEEHFYFYSKVDPHEERKTLKVIETLPAQASSQMRKIYGDMVTAKQNCEAIAFRGHRLLDELNGHMHERMTEASQREQDLFNELQHYQKVAETTQQELQRLRSIMGDERTHMSTPASLDQGLAPLAPPPQPVELSPASSIQSWRSDISDQSDKHSDMSDKATDRGQREEGKQHWNVLVQWGSGEGQAVYKGGSFTSEPASRQLLDHSVQGVLPEGQQADDNIRGPEAGVQDAIDHSMFDDLARELQYSSRKLQYSSRNMAKVIRSSLNARSMLKQDGAAQRLEHRVTDDTLNECDA